MPPDVERRPTGQQGGADDHQEDRVTVEGIAVGPICYRSAEPWTPARGVRNRAEAARRLPPLLTGHRDPWSLRPSDAPETVPGGRDLWELAGQLAAAEIGNGVAEIGTARADFGAETRNAVAHSGVEIGQRVADFGDRCDTEAAGQ